jgi:hypothetical protein
MQIQTRGIFGRGGVLASVLFFAACGASDLGDVDPNLEGSEAELSCQVSQQCSNGTSVSCSSANGICHAGTESGGWVECDGARTYCGVVACVCEPTRRTLSGSGSGFNCGAAWAMAQEDAYDQLASACPKGSCNVTGSQGTCSVGTGGRMASWILTYSCMGPANCQ